MLEPTHPRRPVGPHVIAVGPHVIELDNGRALFVGRVPLDCCKRLPADDSAVLGGRAVREGDELVEYRPLCFASKEEAVAHAEACGHECHFPVKLEE